MACYHSLWAAQTVGQRRAWHDITALLLHARSEDVRSGMTSPSLDCIDGERHREWHDFATLRKHTRSDNVGHGRPSPPLESKHGWTTSRVACHHRLWAAHTVEQHQVWHAIIALGRQTRPNDVEHCITSPPLDCSIFGRCRAWHDITALGKHIRSVTLRVA